MLRLTAGVVCALLAATSHAQSTAEKLAAAMAAEDRPAGDVARDANRQPIETLAFFGFEDDMRVLELIPGGGWYTRLLAPTLADEGTLYVAIGTGRVEERLMSQPGFEGIKVLNPDVEFERTEPYRRNRANKPYSFGVSDLDMVLTFRNLHNFTAEARGYMNKAAFDALKPGGIYGVVDHTARHNEPVNAPNRRRLDPVLAIDEIVAVGFEYVGSSNVHYRPNDDLTKEVGDESVAGKTDRFTLKFRKP
ncbi:MAG: methyltransferase [Pseudomonadota bacterium]